LYGARHRYGCQRCAGEEDATTEHFNDTHDEVVDAPLDGLDSLDIDEELGVEDVGEDDLLPGEDDRLGEDAHLGEDEHLPDDETLDEEDDLAGDGEPAAPEETAGGLNPADAPLTAVPVAGEADPEEDELLGDEVEASLDVILAERMRAGVLDVDDEDEEEDDDDTPTQLATVIPVRRPDEFLCQSCFLLKPPGQLADRTHQLCRDCA
jgi:hypothetical protein